MKKIKRYKKTYGILHLAEKHTVFHLGKARVHVSFTGGQVTKNGVTPATFTTPDPIVQLAIERSKEFEEGAITLLAKYPIQGEVKIGMNPPESKKEGAETAPAPNPGMAKAELIREDASPTPPPIQEETPIDIPEEKPEHDPEPTNEKAEGESTDEAKAEKEEDGESNLEVVEVSCSDVAKQYLQEHFGEKPTRLRRIADIQECAAKYGITFSFV